MSQEDPQPSARRTIRVVAAEVERDGRYLITQRRPSATMPLLWEFPGGRAEPTETDAQALERELYYRLGVGVDVKEASFTVEHVYERYSVDFRVYRAELLGTPECRGVHDLAWVQPENFDQYDFPGADQATVDQLLGLAPTD